MTRDLRDNLRSPGNGFPERAEGGQLPGSSGNHPWALLARGKTLGKRVVIAWLNPIGFAPRGHVVAQPGPVDLLNLNGNDENAQQFCLTLAATKLIPGVDSSNPPTNDIQRLTGEVDAIAAVNTVNNVGGGASQQAPDTEWANAIAIVQWGIGGISERAEIDFFNGMCVNLCASWLRVSAVIIAPAVVTSSVPYVLGAFVGPGYPRPNSAQRTMPLGSIDTGIESQVFTVPRFAKDVTLMGGNATASTAYAGTIRFWRSRAGAADPQYGGVPVAAIAFSSADPRPVIVPSGGYYFSVVSGIAAPNEQQAVFGLTI